MATFYFNGAVDGDWNTLGNWWEDDQFTVAASALPTSGDSVVASAPILINSGSAPTVVDFTTNSDVSINLTATGTATFNDCDYRDTITAGNVVFNGSNAASYCGLSGFITIIGNGNVTFNGFSSSNVDGNNYPLNNNSIGGLITGNVVFNDNSIHGLSVIITGNATFNNDSIKRGSVTGTTTWNSSYPSDGSLVYYYNGSWWIDSSATMPAGFGIQLSPTSIDSIIVDGTTTNFTVDGLTVVNFTLNSPGGGAYLQANLTVTGVATFNDGAEVWGPNTTLTGNAVFNDNSICGGGTLGNLCTINGNAIFNGNSVLKTDGVVTGDATFNDDSIKRGSVDGTITWLSRVTQPTSNQSSGLIYYFNGVVDNNWSTPGNWWLDSGFNVPSSYLSGLLPTSSDSVVASASISSNSGSSPTVVDFTIGGSSYFNITLTATGVSTFNDSSVCYTLGLNSLISNCIFNNSSIHALGANITGDATFNDDSIKRGNVSGTVTYNSTYHDANGRMNYYFNGNSDHNWNNIGNWVVFNNNTGITNVDNIGLPTSIDNVTAASYIDSDSGNLAVMNNFTIGSSNYINIFFCVNGVATFNDSSYLTGNISCTGEAVFNNNSFNMGIISTGTFNDNSIHGSIASISGNATFNGNSIKRGSVGGTVTWNSSYPSDGSLTYYWRKLAGYDWWSGDNAEAIPLNIDIVGLPTTIDSVIASAGIGDPYSPPSFSIKNFTISGSHGAYINLTVSGTATFNDSSHNDGTLTGNATFNNSSSNAGTLTGLYNFIFNDYSYNDLLGAVYYTATFNDYSYNNGSIDPGSFNHPVIFNDNSYNNNSIMWAAIFNNNSYNNDSISANATFNDSSYNVSSITGNVVFNDNSYMEDSGSITGNATFNNESSNRTNISGTVTLNPDRGINGSSILGLV